MNGSLREWAAERGYRVGWGEVSLLEEIRPEIDTRFAAGELDQQVFERYLGKFRYLEDVAWPRVRTVGVVAVPRPAHLVTFRLEKGSLEALVPPTYVRYVETGARVRDELASAISGTGWGVAPLYAPLKLLAARLGLATYGRNNITYVEGLGSYHQLVGFASDGDFGPQPGLEAPGCDATEAALLPRCRNCSACRQACPTGAIGKDRFLLHAQRCLTLWTEGQDPWPDWLSPSVHHCLVGCLACQKACPENAGRLRLEPVAEGFTAEESAAILAHGEARVEDAWAGIPAKLASIGLSGYDSEIGRNLRALVANRQGSRSRGSGPG